MKPESIWDGGELDQGFIWPEQRKARTVRWLLEGDDDAVKLKKTQIGRHWLQIQALSFTTSSFQI